MGGTSGPVLVAGSTGYLGSRVVEVLRGRGLPVRALVRPQTSEASVEKMRALGVELCMGDATNAGALRGACAGATAVVSCLAADVAEHSGTPESIDRDANISLFDAAAAAGSVRVFMLVSTFEGQDARRSVRLDRAKEEAVDHIVAHAAQHNISFIIIRPTAYYKDFTDFPLRRMRASSTMLLIGAGNNKFNPIDGTDLAGVMADLLQDPGASGNKQYQIGGPEVLTLREVALLAARAVGRDPATVRFRAIPVWLMAGTARLLGVLGTWPLGLPWARRLAGMLQFVVYAATHDSVAPRHGSMTVWQHYQSLPPEQRTIKGSGDGGKRN